MGKYSGKVTTVFIAPTGVRVAEGENKNGSPYLFNFFTVGGVENFFTEIVTDPGTYEITNMNGLVETIVNELKNRNVNCKRLMISSDCFGIDTVVRSEKAGISISEALTGDLGALRKQKKKDSNNKLSPDKSSCKIVWGTMPKDGVVMKQITESIGDKFMLKSLVMEFYRRGYEVISLSDTVGSLINFRHTEEATFDSQGKVIFNVGETIRRICLFKDLPVHIEKYPPITVDELNERMDNFIESAVELVGRNPKVYITGEQMRNTDLYNNLVDRLENNGYAVYDLFDKPLADEFGMNPTTGLPVLTADYSANICMFMAPFAKNNISILPPIGFVEAFKKNSKLFSCLILSASVVILLSTVALAASRFLTMQNIQANPPKAPSMEATIQSLESMKVSLESTVTTLTQADVTVLDLMNFIDTHESEFVTIISVDTNDMLPSLIEVDNSGTTQEMTQTDEYSEEIVDTGLSEREPIIVRGYARSGPMAISYFDSMFNSGLPVDPVLNGIEKYELPNGEEVFIFEIQIGDDR